MWRSLQPYVIVAATLCTRWSCHASTPPHPNPNPNQAELLRLDPTLIGSLPSPAAPVLRNIHACFVAGRLLRWPNPDPNILTPTLTPTPTLTLTPILTLA